MNDSGKTLVILTPAFAAGEQDNWLPSQASFVRNLNKVFPLLNVIILTFHFPIIRKRRYNWFGNQVVAFNGGMKGKAHSLIRWARVWQELRKIRRDYAVLGIFSFFCSESAFVGHYFAKRYGLKHYIWVLGLDAKKENKQVRRIRPGGNELIAISDFLVREFYKNHGIKPGYLIPIGINEADFPLNKAERTIDIIGVGSLSPIKQYDVFIAIVKEISRAMPMINAVICGDGSEYHALQQLITDHHLENNLTLLGAKSHPEVLNIMQQSKILLHTSSYEGFGMVCAEALYAGAQVISFCKPMDAAIDHWHIVNNKEEMIARSIQLLQDKDASYSSVLHYNMDDTVVKIMRLYNYDGTSTKPAG